MQQGGTDASANLPDGRAQERRQLTVFFCDLVGSTAMAASLDPEDARSILEEYHHHCSERITKAGGFVAQFLGDGVLGYFGYEQASESDAERAVRVALDLVLSVPEIATELGSPMQVRIGICTGLVVAGDPQRGGTRLEQAAVGDTINLAARLQSIANANEIIIADSTRRLIGNLFVCRNLGRPQLKGYSKPVQVWQVIRARTGAISQFKARGLPVLTPLFGRDSELDLLLRKWRQTAAGNRQVVSIIGDPGIGKSRLIKEFHQRITKEGHVWLETGGSQVFQNTPFFAVSQMILRAFDPVGRATPAQLRMRLVRALGDVGMDSSEAVPLIREMLRLAGAEPITPMMLPPGDKRDRLFAVLSDWLYAEATRNTLIMVIEDLHWLDPSSLELIGMILRNPRPLPALILFSMRKGFRAPAHRKPNRLVLEPLADDDLREIIARVDKSASSLPDEVVGQVVKRADGVPLFAVELTRLMVEQEVSASDRGIPSTLLGLLTARLDQLGSAKAVAQVAAVIGNEVPQALLSIVSGIAEPQLKRDLAELVKSGLMQESGSPAEPIYSFRHSLLRDAAYEALLRSRRRKLHRRAAIALSEQTIPPAARHPEITAPHWEQAGEPRLAIAAWQQAGDASSASRAFREAQNAYQAALSILLSLPSPSERDALELSLQSSLAEVLRITRGYSALQTIRATTRARTLSQKKGDIAQQFSQAVGAWAAASSGGDFLRARGIADEVMELALANSAPVSLANAHMIQMTSRYRVGDLAGAEDYFERGQDLFKSIVFRRQPGWAAQTYGNAARNAWIMGDDGRAQQRIDQGLLIARENDSPYDLAFALYMAAIHAVLCGNEALAEQFAEESIRLSDAHSFPQFAAISRIALGRAKAGAGAPADGITLIRQGLARMADTGSRVAVTLYLTWLAEAQLLGGLLDDGLSCVEVALSTNPEERFFRPATLHLRGDLHARKGLRANAERDFREAMQLSSETGAARFYHRAAKSLQQLTRPL